VSRSQRRMELDLKYGIVTMMIVEAACFAVPFWLLVALIRWWAA